MAETQAALYFSTTGRFEMSFLSAIPVIALLAMLPVLLSLRPVAGVREFSASCALSAASAGALTVAAALQAPVAAMFGYAGLAVALFFVLQGLRRFLALSMPASLCLVLAFSSGVLGFIIALGGHDSPAAGMIVVAGVVAALLLVLGLAAADRWPGEKPAIQVVVVGSAAVVFTALAHALGPSAHVLPGPAGSPASSLFDFLLVTMRVLCLPLLFLAMILTMQARVIAGLRAMIARDGLTGALSRGTLMEEGERIFAECVARQEPAAFLLLDLDFFKQINDQYGHACGDMALAHFADTVSAFLAGRGVLGRIGGEEFGIVLPDHTEEQARALAEDICRVVRETPAGRSHQRIRLTVSIGIAAAIAGETITDVMIRADLALYDSKADGRDRCSVARDRRIDASARALAAAAAQLREARAARSELRHSA
jgi:diguanylate cyclase (GGDEF)-like protein